MVIASPARPGRQPRPLTPPALESGMRLTAEEFDRRYETADCIRAELVQGVVYVASPVRIDEHANPDSWMAAWVTNYSVTHPGTQSGTNATVRLSANDRVQPDALLRKRTAGKSRVADDGYIDGAPELVVEIAASSASIDLNVKKESYRRAGVQEYLVWATEDDRVSWFSLEGREYVELQPDADGWTHSLVFPGLRMHIERLLDGEGSVVLPS